MADPQPQPAPSLSIQKIYVKDLSLENPGAPQSFQVTDAPQIEIGLRTRGGSIEFGVRGTITLRRNAFREKMWISHSASVQ